jgi:glutamate carboxypeptidase
VSAGRVSAAALLAQTLRRETDEMVERTRALAAIDSGSDDAAGVDRVSGAIGEMLARHGFVLEREPLAGAGSKVAATLRLGRGPTLLMVGHADTVWPGGTAAAWPPHREGAMLCGPGVGDMKGALVMAVHALAAARRAGIDGIGSVVVLIVPDEERGSVGSRDWIERHARDAAACLGLEAGWPGGGIVVERGAVGALRVTAHGRTAHCAAHEDEGASAVAALAPLVGRLEALGGGAARLRVGVFRGGVARQVVPDRAELVVDLRAPDARAAAELVERARALVARAGRGEVAVTLEGGVTRPPLPASCSRELWGLARRCAGELALPLAPVASRGGSDASFAASLGVPTIDGLGPICHDSCARRERIEVASLAERGALLALMVVELAARWRQRPPGERRSP